MLDWNRLWGCPLVQVDGHANECVGCNEPEPSQLYIVRVKGITREFPTYYCVDCADMAETNRRLALGEIESIRPARTELVMEPRVYDGVLSIIHRKWERKTPATLALFVDALVSALSRLPKLHSWSDDTTYQRRLHAYLDEMHEPTHA